MLDDIIIEIKFTSLQKYADKIRSRLNSIYPEEPELNWTIISTTKKISHNNIKETNRKIIIWN